MKASPSCVEKLRSSTITSTSGRAASRSSPSSGFSASTISAHCGASASRNAERMSGWSSTINAVSALERSCMPLPGDDSTSPFAGQWFMVLPEPLARRLAAARAADAPEFEQVLIRLAIGVVIVTYLLVSFEWDGHLDAVERWILLWVAMFLALSLGLLGWCAIRPGVMLPRRWSAAMLDVS